MEMRQRSTTSPTTVIIDHDIKPRADTFTGKPKRVDKDGACLFSSLGGQHAKKLVREALGDWLKKNPHFPFYTTTLAQYVLDETGEVWSVYCARMQSDRTWGGLPELVAASQVWRRVVRVFENIGDGLYVLRAVLGEEGFYTVAIDLVLEKNHYDALTEVHQAKMIQPEKVAEACPPKTTPIEALTLELKALGRLKELESCLRPKMPEQLVEPSTPEKIVEPTEPEIEHKAPTQLVEPVEPKPESKAPEQPAKPKAERKARKELVERQVLDDLAERKELKELEEHKARERHAMRKFIELLELVSAEVKILEERKGEGKVPDHLTVPKAEPEAKDLGARKQPKHYESRKVRAAREMREGLLAYRAHRALEERAAYKAREELARANEVIKVQRDRQARATSKEREAQKAREATACRRGQGALDAPAEIEPRGSHQPQDRTPSSRFLTVLSGVVPPRAGRDGRSPLAR